MNAEVESEDPLYANIEPATVKRNSMRQSKKTNKQADDGGVEIVQQRSSRTGAESSAANKILQSAIQQQDNVNEEDNVECGLGAWNPQKTVAHLYPLPDVKETNEYLHNGAAEMEGFLERLPPGKKKSTIWNSWKRQYFVAKAGLLKEVCCCYQTSRAGFHELGEEKGNRMDHML